MERWKMHKLGFVNFWLYEREEFLLEDGHLLLRGVNASGKSVTTQSFIPFILDGDMDPVRLDPFGSRARRMEYYLLGDDGEREESTGYLYLEFRKPGFEEYLTIGVGMCARKGQPRIDFWGFCLHDGRRIGANNGVSLCRKVGVQWLPLSKQELKNEIASPESWTESPEKYKELVNKWVFQFQEIRQYDQLIKLLVKIRAPKLSRDKLRPSTVRTILDESLQILTDDDLSVMVATMKRMDALKKDLDSFRAAMGDAQIIRREYERYNRFILGKKGKAYLDARERADQCRDALEASVQQRNTLEQNFQNEKQRYQQSKERLETAQRAREDLGEDDVSEKQRRLDSLTEDLEKLKTREEQEREELQSAENKAAQNEIHIREKRTEWSDSRQALDMALKELSNANGTLELGEEHDLYVAAAKQGRNDRAYQTVTGALRRRREQVETVLRLLADAARAKQEYDDASERMDDASVREAEAEKMFRDAENMEREERDKLIEAFAEWEERNEQIALSEEERLTIRRKLSEYQSGADWSFIRNLVDDRRRERAIALEQNRTRTEGLMKQARDEANEQRRQLESLRNLGEAEPPRRETVKATRTMLSMRGIPFAPFYQTIDFAPELSMERRQMLEAQLRDAGLLDALVVPSAYLAEFEDLLEQSPDTFLLPGTAVKEPIADLVPDTASRFQEEAARILEGISRSDMEAETALLSDGRFHCGAVYGRSMAEDGESDGFIGVEARRQRLQSQIQQKQERLTALEEEVRKREEEIVSDGRKLERLKEEWEAMPSAAELDETLELLRATEQNRNEAVLKRERASKAEQDARIRKGEAERRCRAQSEGLPYRLEIPCYKEALDYADEYQNQLSEVHDKRLSVDICGERVRDLEYMSGVLRDNVENFRRNCENLQRERRQTESRMLELRTWLERPENQERARRLEDLNREIDACSAEVWEADKQCAVLSNDIQRVKDSLIGLHKEALDAEAAADKYGAYFREDLELGFSGLDLSRPLEANASDAWGAVPKEDRTREPIQLGTALLNNCQQHANNLLKYHLEQNLTFDEQDGETSVLRARYCVTLRWKEARLSLFDFIKELQKSITTTETVFTDSDRELFENILTQTVSQQLRARIEESVLWVKSMTELMSRMRTSMRLVLSLDWKPKKADSPEEMDTEELVRLLNKDTKLLTDEDMRKAAAHFKAKVRRSRERADTGDIPADYADIIRDALDYRKWYDFRLFFRRSGDDRRDLTDAAFNRFSGGEKAMSMYVPLFAALSAHYKKASPSCPLLLALDEAFAGVDEQNISAIFDLIGALGFDYIMNSQALWGCYEGVGNLDIAELHCPAGEKMVVVIRYHWNGKERILLKNP